jgi:leucyl aminopeptidase
MLREIDLHAGPRLDLARLRAGGAAANLARWLTALPPNVLDAGAYRRALTGLAADTGLELQWLDEVALRRLGAGAFLAVAAGNASRDAGIARLSWKPRRRGKPRTSVGRIALVGKGILFDTGGTNLKQHRGMLDMHTDMAGSAVALATLIALSELRSPLAAEGWLAITENRTGPTAYRPQDVVTAVNGTTIQVIHTDAEGRMALADTLALAGRARPALIVDFATLTGACVYALTERMSGVFTNRPALHARIEAAGQRSGERVHCFPMPADYDAELESKVADVLQCAVDGKGDHILAARFLARFVPADCTWLHVDLSSATRSGGLAHVNTDVTGFGVRFTLEALEDASLRAQAPA